MRQITGNKLLVRALKEEGVDTIFGYPGACTIDISDELYRQDEIKVILPRHEQALVHAADAYARTTGKVGVCLVTSGPGATNLVTGLATANYDSVPLVCFTGQVARHLIGNDAFQEVDIVGITRSITKYGVTVSKREDLGRIIKEAFYIARTGRPGPVLIDLPKDVMSELGSPEYPETVNRRGYKPNTSECDLLFSIGTRFNDRITGKLHEFAPNAQIVHIDIDTASISRNIHVHVPIVADAKEAVAKMREYVEPCETKEWLERIAQWNAEHPLTMKVHGSIGPRDIIEEMNRQFDDAIITTDVGQHQMFVTQYAEVCDCCFGGTSVDSVRL